MTKEQFFEHICRNCITEEEKIFAILVARGFLIEKIGSRYYLSDNAHAEDARYLAKAIEVYNIGEVIDSGERIKSSRKVWNINCCERSYQYDSLSPHAVEICIASNAQAKQAVSLFEGLEIHGGEAGANTISWLQYSREMLGKKVKLDLLEPYIAYYVKAVSACGVYTASSCDGNHEECRRMIVEADGPSDIWHRSIWEFLVKPHFDNIPFVGNCLPLTESNQFERYLQIHEIAAFLYKNRIAIRAIKEQSVSGIVERYRKSRVFRKKAPSEWKKQMDDYYALECQRVLAKVSSPADMEKGEYRVNV